MAGGGSVPEQPCSQTRSPSPFPTSFKEGVLHLQGGQPSLLPPQYPKATLTDRKNRSLRPLGVSSLQGVRGKGPFQGCPAILNHTHPPSLQDQEPRSPAVSS